MRSGLTIEKVYFVNARGGAVRSSRQRAFPVALHQICGFFLTPPMHCARALLLLLCLSAAVRAEDFQGSTHALPYDESVINYSSRTPADPVALLQKRLAGGETALAWDDRFGYLPAILDALHVPKSSQMLVFSKTSLQRSHISPENPRALFFNDDVYVGYIPARRRWKSRRSIRSSARCFTRWSRRRRSRRASRARPIA